MARPKKIQPGVVSDPDEVFSLKTSELLWMRDKVFCTFLRTASHIRDAFKSDAICLASPLVTAATHHDTRTLHIFDLSSALDAKVRANAPYKPA